MVTYRRHLNEQLRFRLTCYDGGSPAAGILPQRQSMNGVTDLRCSIYRLPDMAAVVLDDHAHCVIEENSITNVGDIMYDAPPGTITESGRYLVKFSATIASIPVDFPEESYILLIVT